MGRQSSVAGSQLPLAGNWAFAAIRPRPMAPRIDRPQARPANRHLTTHDWPSAIGYWPSATAHRPPATGNCHKSLRLKYFPVSPCGSNSYEPSPISSDVESITYSFSREYKSFRIKFLPVTPFGSNFHRRSITTPGVKSITYGDLPHRKPFVIKCLPATPYGSNFYRPLSVESIIYSQNRGRGEISTE